MEYNYIKRNDCLELMKELPDNSIDMILCDLPYGTTDCKWDNIIDMPEMWKQYKRAIKDNGAIVLFSAQPFTTKLIYSNLKHFRYCWYWKKRNVTGFAYARYQPMRCIEDICVFYKKAPTYNPQGLTKLERKVSRKKVFREDFIYKSEHLTRAYQQKYTNYPKHLLEFQKDKENYHPTQKPVALLEYLIKTYTNEGEVVLDNCMGSGSTCVAAINTGRKYIGYELDPNYFDIAKERIATAKSNLNIV